MISEHLQPSSNHSNSVSLAQEVFSFAFDPRVELISANFVSLTSSGLKSGWPTISMRSLKSRCDFRKPLFQYHSPRRKEL